MNEQLIQRIRECPSLPTLPSVAVQVLDLTQKADVDIAEIAGLVTKDPALSSKILKTVNSSFYGRSKAVGTISQALVILGLQSVKTLVLGFSLVTNLKNAAPKGFPHMTYWRRSIYGATAARQIAAKLNVVQQEEAFLATLLKDIGMLVLGTVMGDEYGQVLEKAATHEDLVALEQDTFGATHTQVGGLLAEQWQLPPVLVTPIREHHTPEAVTDPSLRKLTEVVQLGGRCADVFVDENAARPISRVRELAKAVLGMDEAQADELLADVGKRTREVATLFEINLGTPQQYESILKKANETLVQLTLQSQMQASQLALQNQQLKEAALTDALTGLANRKEFDQRGEALFREATQSGRPLSLLMIDLDKFKSVNDTYGHPAGDAVLRAVARILKVVARKSDVAARYGGEEMALLLPATDRAGAAAIAERFRLAVAAKPIVTDKHALKVTASIGVATWEPNTVITRLPMLVKAADLALYQAKHGGRNCVKIIALKKSAA